VSGLQQRVTFRFGTTADVYYLRDVPEVGDHVSHMSEIWVVARVEVDDGGVLVTCKPPAPTPRQGKIKTLVWT